MKKNTLSLAVNACLLLSIPTIGASAQSYAQTDESSIEKVTVVSSRIAQPANQLATSVSVIDEEMLKSRVSLNITDILRSSTSVGVSNAGGLGKTTVLRIRGEEGFRTKLYIDGVELSDPSSPQVSPIFDDILTGHLSRIEILRGAQGLAYGADAGGVISMFTKTPSEGLSTNLSFGASRYNTQEFAASLSAGSEHGSILVATSSLSSDGFNAQTSDTSGEEDGYDNQSLYLKALYRLNDRIDVSLVVRQVDADNHYDGCFDNITFAQINTCTTDSDQQTIRTAINYAADSGSHQLAFNRTDVERRFINDGVFSFENKGQVNKFEYLGNTRLLDHNLVYGAEMLEEEIVGQDLSRKQNSVFIEWLGEFDDTLFLNVGARQDDNDTFGNHTSLRAGAAKLVEFGNATLKIKSSIGTGFRAPSLFEQNYNDGPFAFGEAAGLQLVEENSEGLDIGFELYNIRGTKLEVVWFEQSIENEIIFDNAGFQGYLQSTGTSRSKGVEFNIEHTFANSLTFWANYTYNDAQDGTGNKRLRRPKNKANFGVLRTFLDDDLNIELTHRIVNGAVDIGGEELDDYTITDFSMRYQASDLFSVKLGLTNLFDRKYQEVRGFNTAGRSLYISTDFSF
ncbi:TonB-dependent siderophore receptor [Aliiglaciecola sp. M165]|uniref:TonB-dependent receptor plug domain-containing protein n=1 Tax=Aliiglaciecola sp. M165 TaxID=2593649 RepID=UPI00117D0211|nr:TonB-dependent receptor [Aliiglaciecola sp. M165]TRY32015.1 TonB-dependent receptor [Aliiglaciecola sp. M165]